MFHSRSFVLSRTKHYLTVYSIDETRIKHILASHLIDFATLQSDNFDALFRDREAALLDRIESAMGKPIAREIVLSEEASAVIFEDEESLEE